MPPPSQIEHFDPHFFRPCSFPMLRQLGYDTRVTLNNGVAADSPFATRMAVHLSVFDEDGGRLVTLPDIITLESGQVVKLDIDSLVEPVPEVPSEGQLLCVLHVIPEALADQADVTVSTAELMAHFSVSDDFIEYRQRTGDVIAGVAYQTGPMNDRRFSSTRTTVCQAPKVIVTEPVDTLMCLLNVSTSLGYSDAVTMDFWILGPGGERVARSNVEVPAFSYRLVSMEDTLREAGQLESFREAGAVGMFLGYAKNGSLVPLSMTRNKETGAIACDHTLPPPYYITTWGGEARLRGNARLEEELFAEAAQPSSLAVR